MDNFVAVDTENVNNAIKQQTSITKGRIFLHFEEPIGGRLSFLLPIKNSLSLTKTPGFVEWSR